MELTFFDLSYKNRQMTNTEHFQHLPDFFSSREEGKQAIRENTNPRYKFFRQTHFTAGDYEQFLEFWDSSSHQKEISCGESALPLQVRSSLYQTISSDDVFGTFEYMFHKFKKGIFVKIVSNELKVFLPFSKIDYTNEWSYKVFTSSPFEDLFIESSRISGYPYDKRKIHFLRDHWYANNGLLRYEYPISENDSGVSTLRDMLICLTKEREVPDCEFFLNKRDFPILKQNRTEPYECLFGEDHPLVSHNRERYCPILSMTTTQDHADIPIPTWEDWARVEFPQKWFGKEFASYPDPYIPFSEKKFPTAVFRGSSTGLGTTPETNPRIFFSLLSKKGIRDQDGHLFLECGITKWNGRPRRCSPNDPYQTFSSALVEELGVSRFMPLFEQSRYKYILHLPGHSESYRLSFELGTGSVILMWPCKYKLWFSHLLEPFVHYVPVEKDIFETIRWCKQNEEKCAFISQQAKQFYDTYLSRNSILNYFQNLLGNLQKQTGKLKFCPKNLMSFQETTQQKWLQKEKSSLLQLKLPRDFQHHDCASLHPRTFQLLLHQCDEKFIEHKIEEAPIFKESRNVILKKIVLFGRTLCIKFPKEQKDKDLDHESFIGQAGTNRFANICPMIAYVFGKWGKYVIMDFIEGESLDVAIQKKDPKQVLSFFIQIFLQILVLLRFLQNEMGFIHFDLYPWNIMIRKNKEKKVFQFSLGKGQSIRFCPEVYPVLIDFGKSHIVHENIHHVKVSPFRINFYQDVISIFISSIYQILHSHKIPIQDSQSILKMVTHIAPSSYTNYRPLSSISSLKQFIRTKKKFSNMLLDEKLEFQKKDPLDFFFFFQKHHLGDLRHSRILSTESDLVIKGEVCYSSFFSLKEILTLLNLCSKNLWDEFKKERLDLYEHQNSSSSILHAYHTYLNSKMMEQIFPEKIDKSYRQTVKTILTSLQDFSFTDEKLANHNSKLKLPLFFSHPEFSKVLATNQITDNRYESKHKLLHWLTLASFEYPELSSLRKNIFQSRGTYLDQPFCHFQQVSTGLHLQKFKQWLSI